MKLFSNTVLWMVIIGSLAAEETTSPKHAAYSTEHAIYLKYPDFKWEKLNPELGELSAEISILHVNPKSGATQFLLRLPKNYHVPKHWHTANETHYSVYGHFLMRDHDGQVADLSPGSFNYMPSKMNHEGWTNPKEGTLLYVTLDGPFDIHYIDGPPTSQQVQDMSNRPIFQ